MTWTPKQIREFRLEMNMTQARFGDLVGVSEQYIYYLERGARNPSKTLCLLLECINDISKEGVCSKAR